MTVGYVHHRNLENTNKEKEESEDKCLETVVVNSIFLEVIFFCNEYMKIHTQMYKRITKECL